MHSYFWEGFGVPFQLGDIWVHVCLALLNWQAWGIYLKNYLQVLMSGLLKFYEIKTDSWWSQFPLSLVKYLNCVFMFRDGVSESQFEQVLTVELNQIIKVNRSDSFLVQFDNVLNCWNLTYTLFWVRAMITHFSL